MTDYSRLIIEPLNSAHNRPGFHCGIEALDDYLKKQARQDIKRRISRIFVASLPESPNEVIAYYSLSALSIQLNQLPAAVARKLPKDPIPSALLGRLAVSQRAIGQGIGRMILVDATKRTLSVSAEIAIYAIVVDAIDKDAQRFYEKFGFTRLSSEGGVRLFLPLQPV